LARGAGALTSVDFNAVVTDTVIVATPLNGWASALGARQLWADPSV